MSNAVPVPELFASLSADDRARLLTEFETLSLTRGAVLVREGEAAEYLYIVMSGRFCVTRTGRHQLLHEIGAGEAVGEIAFFAGGVRTATVTALRDAIVLRLARADYEALAARLPALPAAVTAMLARRLADTTSGYPATPDPRPRTIALIAAGNGNTLTPEFRAQLVAAFALLGYCYS